MLEGDSTSFKVNHFSGVNITHRAKKSKFGFAMNWDDEIRSKLLKK
jgi:hypothetical protein